MNLKDALNSMHYAFPGLDAEIKNLNDFPNLQFGRWVHPTKKEPPTAQELQQAYDTFIALRNEKEAQEATEREGRKNAAAAALNIPKGQEAVIAKGLAELIQDNSVASVAALDSKHGGGKP